MNRTTLCLAVVFVVLLAGVFFIKPSQPATIQPDVVVMQRAAETEETEMVFLPSVSVSEQDPVGKLQNLGGLSIVYDESVSFEAVATKSFVEQIVQGSGVFEAGSRGTVLSQVAEGDVYIPDIGQVGPPCLSGHSTTLTGYDWYAHAQHPAVDIACTPWDWNTEGTIRSFMAVAPMDCTVVAILSEEWEANSYFSSGITVICQAGDNFAGFGHLDVEGLQVTQAGLTLSAGDPIGTISTRRVENGATLGTTGQTTGPHIHYFWGHKTDSDHFEFVNPHEMGAFGTREAQLQIEVTPPVALGNLPENFASAHVSLDQLPFITLKGDSKNVVVAGNASSSIVVAASLCKEENIVENIKITWQAFHAAAPDASARAILSLILTETGFRNFTDNGNGCELLQNYAGAPAFGMTQIYMPAHPDIDKSRLIDVKYAAEVGAQIYADFYESSGGDEVLAAACYKGFCSSAYPSPKDATGFVNNFMGAYQKDGFFVESAEGELWIPFDEASLLQVLGL
jgi:hypothetical protein